MSLFRLSLWMFGVPPAILLMGWLQRVSEKGWEADWRDLLTLGFYAVGILVSAVGLAWSYGRRRSSPVTLL